MDVLVLMDEPAFPGCLLKCRVISIIEGRQGKKKKGEHNDRIVAIDAGNHCCARVLHVNELGKKLLRELGRFYLNYHGLRGQKYSILNVKGPAEAHRRIKDGTNAVRKRKN